MTTFRSAADPTERAEAPQPGTAAIKQPLRVLLVEDNADDVLLVLRLLRRNGYDPVHRQVQTAAEMEQAISAEKWDIVLSDYNLPQFDALRALSMVRQHSELLPFIIISGSIGEETAVAAMRAGANDYLMKTNLARLLPAVEREMREASAGLERARTQKALLDLQGKFQVIFREYLDVMMVLDAATGKILHANHAASEVMGYDEEWLKGKTFATLWPEGERSQAWDLLERVRCDGSLLYSGGFRRQDGSSCPMDMLANQVAWGRRQAIIVTLHDVSDRQYAEQRLADEKEHLAVTLRSMGEGVITTDSAGCVLLLNRVAERLTGWQQEEAAGKSLCEVLQLVHAKDQELCDNQIKQVLGMGETVEITKHLALRHRNGGECALALNSSPIRSGGGKINGVVVIFRDTTAEQARDEELQKASRLESVGVLAGGIAHDFNNVLTAIMGHVSLAKANATPLETFIATVEKACQYASDLTRQLLTFSKDTPPIRRVVAIGEIVKESVEFSLHGSSLRCRFDLAGDLHPTEVDRNQINQVLNNLVINAIQASPPGASLGVSARNVSVTRDHPNGALLFGDYVRIDIRDNGKGIEPEHLSKIFDPYFTTKSTGSGLGLSTSYSIIHKHEGSLQVESELGKGTTFAIYLPAYVVPTSTTDAMENAATSTPKEEPTPAGGGRVLFMDDEETLQELVGALLNHLGYAVTCAGHGQQAIELYAEAQAAGQPFAAVIVDLTVPGGMGGYEAVQVLRSMDPNVKAIVSSGYSNDPIMFNFREHGFTGVIAKPYQLSELGDVLQKVIQAPSPNAAGGLN